MSFKFKILLLQYFLLFSIFNLNNDNFYCFSGTIYASQNNTWRSSKKKNNIKQY